MDNQEKLAKLGT